MIGLLEPIFIPFLVFDKLDWSFWGWLKAYLGFSFYKVVAAATPAASGKALRVHQHADTVLRSAQVHLAAQRNLGLHSGPEGVDVAVSLTR